MEAQAIDIEFRRTEPHGMITGHAHSPRAVEWVREMVDLDWQEPEFFAIEKTEWANDILQGAVASGMAVRQINVDEVHDYNVETES